MNKSRFMFIFIEIGLICACCSYGQPETIRINLPLNGAPVQQICDINGTSSATSDTGMRAYVLIWSHVSSGPWIVQYTNTSNNGSWSSPARFDRVGYFFVDAIITRQVLMPYETFPTLPDGPMDQIIVNVHT